MNIDIKIASRAFGSYHNAAKLLKNKFHDTMEKYEKIIQQFADENQTDIVDAAVKICEESKDSEASFFIMAATGYMLTEMIRKEENSDFLAEHKKTKINMSPEISNSSIMEPTPLLRWVDRENQFYNPDGPPLNRPEKILQQLWKPVYNQGQPEWRDVPVEKEN